jgi:hypothetical protein
VHVEVSALRDQLPAHRFGRARYSFGTRPRIIAHTCVNGGTPARRDDDGREQHGRQQESVEESQSGSPLLKQRQFKHGWTGFTG